MAKYAFYKLTKVKGKKEYIPETMFVFNSMKAAYDELQSYWDDCLDGPVWLNDKIGETVAYERYDRILFVPNYTEVQDADGCYREKLLGIYRRFPVYCIDQYPNPYKAYKERMKNGGVVLEGIE